MASLKPRTAKPLLRGSVAAELLAFERSPGRYAVAQGEPRVLFGQAREVLLLASGRSATPEQGEPSSRVRRAARFFIRTAMLRAGADPYTLLGLEPDADLNTVREHYRLLIRLTHPDYAQPEDAWPADAAARVNLAQDTLCSPPQRERLDAQRQAQQRTSDSLQPTQGLTAVRAARPAQAHSGARQAEARSPRIGVYLSGGVVAAVVLLALVMVWSVEEDDSLQVMAPGPMAPVVSPAVPLPAPLPAAVAARPPAEAPRLPKAGKAAPQAVATADPGTQMNLSYALSTPNSRALDAALNTARGRSGTGAQAAPALPDDSADAMRLTQSLESAPGAARPPPAAAPEEAAPRAAAAPAKIDMRQLHLVLTELVQTLQSGRSDRVRAWVERSTPAGHSAAGFTEAYSRALAGARVTGIGQVRFTTPSTAEPPVIDGLVQLRLQDSNQQDLVRDFRLRAHFVQRETGPVLSRLEAE